MNTSRVRAGDRDIVVSGKVIRTAQIDGDTYRFTEDPAPLLAGLQNCGQRVDLFTFLQRVPETAPKHSFPMEIDNFAVLELTTYEEWWTKQLNNKTRNMVRTAEKKGIVVREISFDESVARGIWEIYNESPIRQGRKFFNYGKTLERVTREASTFLDCSVFVGAFVGDRLVGFTKFTIDETGTQAGLMHIISLIEHRDKAPTNALIAHTVKACCDRGIRYLVYSHFAYGNKTQDTLADFKKHNGFKRVDVPRYFVPLTPLGHVALRLGLHLSLHHHTPEALITVFRKYRSAWYNRKHSGPVPTNGSKAA